MIVNRLNIWVVEYESFLLLQEAAVKKTHIILLNATPSTDIPVWELQERTGTSVRPSFTAAYGRMNNTAEQLRWDWKRIHSNSEATGQRDVHIGLIYKAVYFLPICKAASWKGTFFCDHTSSWFLAEDSFTPFVLVGREVFSAATFYIIGRKRPQECVLKPFLKRGEKGMLCFYQHCTWTGTVVQYRYSFTCGQLSYS